MLGWAGMRVALKLVAKTLALSWGYAPVSSLGSSLFYQNFSKSLENKKSKGKGLPLDRASLLVDNRNTSSRWLILKKHLTPLAATEKKTISGFDTRLVSLKSPRKIKWDRRQLYCFYLPRGKGGTFEGLGTAHVLSPFISQAPGWGARSSKRLSYLKEAPFSALRKPNRIGFLRDECLPSNSLISSKGLFQVDLTETEEGGVGQKTLLFVSIDLFLSKNLLLEKAYSEGGESPNLTPQVVESALSLENLESSLEETLHWARGNLNYRPSVKTLSTLVSLKGALAKGIILS